MKIPSRKQAFEIYYNAMKAIKKLDLQKNPNSNIVPWEWDTITITPDAIYIKTKEWNESQESNTVYDTRFRFYSGEIEKGICLDKMETK